jgi:hypothetical protein
MRSFVARFKVSCNLIGDSPAIPYLAIPPTLATRLRAFGHSGVFATKDKLSDTANAQNSIFANRTNRHTTKVCKRAVLLPSLARKLIHLWYLIRLKNEFRPIHRQPKPTL